MWTHPQRAVAGGRTNRKRCENEFHILACKRREVNIHVECLTFIALEEGPPKRGNLTGGRFVIETEGNVTQRRAAFAGDR